MLVHWNRNTRCCRRYRRSESNLFIEFFDAWPVDFKAGDFAFVPALFFLQQRVLSNKMPFIHLHEASKAKFERRIFLRLDYCFLAAVEIDFDQQKSSLNSCHI